MTRSLLLDWGAPTELVRSYSWSSWFSTGKSVRLNEVKQTSNYSRDNKLIIKAVTLCTEVTGLITHYINKQFQRPVQIYRPLCPPHYHSVLI
jgi:hypothetical protein